MKNSLILIAVALVVILGIGWYFWFEPFSNTPAEPIEATEPTNNTQATTTSNIEGKSTIGTSVEGREIAAYSYGTGDKEILFVGGIHGGYSWNTALVAYELVEHLEENPDAVPENVRVTVIPVLNPDGLNKIVGTSGPFSPSDVPTGAGKTVPGRFNANTVDLNRNFDCDWQREATWQNTKVSGGDEAFSEPESKAIKAYIEAHKPSGVVVWYSAAGGVFASNCHGTVLAETRELTNLYAKASGYKAYNDFNFYEITGDMVNWLAKNNIPAISVLLTTHTDVEWDKNWKGIEALLAHYKE